MEFSQKIVTVDSHTMGEPARIIISGPVAIKGSTVREKRDYFKKNYDYIRTSVINEPRGHSGMFAALVTEPCHPDADVGLIYMDNQVYVNMCVHATIAATVVILETGMIVPSSPAKKKLVIETPSGLVQVEAECDGNKVKKVHLINVPSFTLLKDVEIGVRGKRVRLDVSYGGNTFAVVHAEQIGIPVRQTHVDELISWGMDIRKEANRQLKFSHPENPQLNVVDQVLIHGEPTRKEAHSKNIIISGLGKADRSPCGTGTCARLASLYIRGVMKAGDTFINEGIIGTCFECRIIEEKKIGEYRAIVPQISGNAYITGFNTLLIDDEDPLKHGFMLKQFE
ncbi:MAG: proline racemase [Spirochaetes bacterium]|nr:MAG: proline racemase [Spirochaetota bacterium]